jgi:hypothetical protein
MKPPPYSAIVDRPPLRWPGGARVAVWPMLAIEHFVWGEPGTALQPLLMAHPEVAIWAWRDYGNRVGVWRLFDLFDALDVPLTICLNAEVCEHYLRIIAAIKDHPGWTVLPHGQQHCGASRSRSRCRAGVDRPDFGDPRAKLWSNAERLHGSKLEHDRGYVRSPPRGRGSLHD